jgi:Zn ribbon nucleic-acid-binding protein
MREERGVVWICHFVLEVETCVDCGLYRKSAPKYLTVHLVPQISRS